MEVHSRFRLPMPRLLPLTILAMFGLLALKSGHLVMAATGPKEAGTAISPAKAEPAVSEQHGGATTAPPPQPVAQPQPPPPRPSPSPPPASGTDPEPIISEAERALLTDLRQRRIALDQRAAELSTREVALAAVERRMSGRVDELSALQGRLEALERQRKEHDEANWRGLVKLYETMKPREAALIFNDLDLQVLLPVLDRMKETKAASVLSAMTPDRARLVTTELAQLRAKASALPGAGG